jgi:hypothetical protein
MVFASNALFNWAKARYWALLEKYRKAFLCPNELGLYFESLVFFDAD